MASGPRTLLPAGFLFSIAVGLLVLSLERCEYSWNGTTFRNAIVTISAKNDFHRCV
jgi:hypothetical protein